MRAVSVVAAFVATLTCADAFVSPTQMTSCVSRSRINNDVSVTKSSSLLGMSINICSPHAWQFKYSYLTLEYWLTNFCLLRNVRVWWNKRTCPIIRRYLDAPVQVCIRIRIIAWFYPSLGPRCGHGDCITESGTGWCLHGLADQIREWWRCNPPHSGRDNSWGAS